MHDYLVFQLRGDFASWGDVAVGERRPTLWFPTKSAIIGLIAAALGIERTEEQTLFNLSKAIQYAAAVDMPEQKLVGYNNEYFKGNTYSGGYMRDYHTTQSASEPDLRQFSKTFGRTVKSRKDQVMALSMTGSQGTILSYRDYRLDAAYVVAIYLDDQSIWTLEMLQEALLTPKFHLYLGRKACAINLPLSPKIIEADSFAAAIKGTDFAVNSNIKVSLKNPTIVAESGTPALNGFRPERSEEYRVFPRSRSRWQFDSIKMDITTFKGDHEC